MTTPLDSVDTAPRVHVVRVAGSQRDIGRQLAQHATRVHGTSADPRRVAADVERVRRRWFRTHHPAHAERALGVADHHGLDPADTSVALDWLGTYDLPAGCSVAFYPGSGTKDGHGILARNFDFPTATINDLVGLPADPRARQLAADPWVVEMRPDVGYASVTVGIMDVLGAMDGINDAGLAVALLADNESPDPEPSGGPQVGLAEQQVVRYLLDSCATVDEALDALRVAKHYYFFTPCHYVISDASGRSVVWEHSPRRNREHVVEASAHPTGRLVCTNHLLHRWPDPAALPDDSGSIGTAAFTYHRWRTLHDAVGDGPIVDRAAIREHLGAVRFEAPTVGGRTYWQALYDVDEASLEVSFFGGDVDGTSRYEAPLRVDLR